jgi:hypothetical protein
VRFVVVRDNDGSDCRALKQRLVEITRDGGRDDTLVRIACQELEAWYFGAPGALANAFGRPALRRLADGARFRDPDAIDQPARALAEQVEEFQKISGARRMTQHLSRDNRSRSFQVLMEGIELLASDMDADDQRRGGN